METTVDADVITIVDVIIIVDVITIVDVIIVFATIDYFNQLINTIKNRRNFGGFNF